LRPPSRASPTCPGAGPRWRAPGTPRTERKPWRLRPSRTSRSGGHRPKPKFRPARTCPVDRLCRRNARRAGRLRRRAA
jgi:hypothetical protein